MTAYLLLFSVAALGSLITSLTGLGGGSLVLAGLLLIYPPELAIPLHSFTQLAANGLRVAIFRKAIHWRAVGAYASLMLPAAWIAALVFELINPSILKILVGLVIIVSIFPWKLKSKDEPSMKTFVVLGGVSGFLGVFVGSIGPMVTPFFNRLKVGREGNISSKSAGQLILQISKIIAFTGAAGINFGPIKEHIGVLMVSTLIGVGISIPISRKISDEKFDKLVNGMLILISLKVIYEGVRELLT